MTHGSAGDDNPVSLNVAPMVDIIFCLCIFFMCSFHFKQLEGKLESWLPKNDGNQLVRPDHPPLLGEGRVTMPWTGAESRVVRKIGSQEFASDAELAARIRESLDLRAKSGEDVPTILDATPDVPWKDVV